MNLISYKKEPCEHICSRCDKVWSHFEKPGTTYCFLPDVVKIPCYECTKIELEANKKKKEGLKFSNDELVALLNHSNNGRLELIQNLSESQFLHILIQLRELYSTLTSNYNKTFAKTWQTPEIDGSSEISILKPLPREQKPKKKHKEKSGSDDEITKLLLNDGFTVQEANKALPVYKSFLKLGMVHTSISQTLKKAKGMT